MVLWRHLAAIFQYYVVLDVSWIRQYGSTLTQYTLLPVTSRGWWDTGTLIYFYHLVTFRSVNGHK